MALMEVFLEVVEYLLQLLLQEVEPITILFLRPQHLEKAELDHFRRPTEVMADSEEPMVKAFI
jgi:hypothetical protein